MVGYRDVLSSLDFTGTLEVGATICKNASLQEFGDCCTLGTQRLWHLIAVGLVCGITIVAGLLGSFGRQCQVGFIEVTHGVVSAFAFGGSTVVCGVGCFVFGIQTCFAP